MGVLYSVPDDCGCQRNASSKNIANINQCEQATTLGVSSDQVNMTRVRISRTVVTRYFDQDEPAVTNQQSTSCYGSGDGEGNQQDTRAPWNVRFIESSKRRPYTPELKTMTKKPRKSSKKKLTNL